MDELPSGDLVLRPCWPMPQLGVERTSYGAPLIAVTGASLIFAVTRWCAIGLPQTGAELFWILASLAATGTAVAFAFLYDGVTITANRERLVLARWLRAPVTMPLTGIVVMQLSTEQTTDTHGRKFDHPIVSFLNPDGQCVLSLDWGQFTDGDLDQLSKVTGVRQDGGWFYKHAA